MFYLSNNLIRDSRTRQGLTWFVLLTVLFALVGVISIAPRPVATDGETLERFPCENCPCGCSTAEYCWDKCCCHTDLEKLQWAEAHNVEPPEFLVRRAGKAFSERKNASKPSCCGGECGSKPAANPLVKSTGGCCGQVTQVSQVSQCCEVKSTDASESDSLSTGKELPENVDQDHSGSQLILVWKAAECRGLSYLLSLLSQAYAGEQPRGLEPAFVCFGRCIVEDEFAPSSLFRPDPPIP